MELMAKSNLAESLGQIESKGDWLKGLGKLGVFFSNFLSLCIFLQSFTFLFHFLFLPSTQLPYICFAFHTLMSHDKTTKHNDNYYNWPSNTCGLQFYVIYLLLRQDWTSVLSLRDQLPHHLQQATLHRCLPGSQYLLFLPELNSHLSQLPQSQRTWLKDDDHGAETNKDERTL